MDYKERITRVIEVIDNNLGTNLNLDDLSSIACFSKYHFHRIFTAYTGVSLQYYIKWKRLKRAASDLVVKKNKPIIEIAMDAGFDSHESFSRSFKKICSQTPSNFRSSPNWNVWDGLSCLVINEGENVMNVEIKNLSERRLALVEHHGDYKKLENSVSKLILWAKRQNIDLLPKPKESFGFAYNDPKKTEAKDFRFDIAVTIPQNFKLDGEVLEKRLPEGRYAIVMHKGSRKDIDQTIYRLYRQWLPRSGEEPGNLPCIFCYHNFDHEVKEADAITEIWLLLK